MTDDKCPVCGKGEASSHWSDYGIISHLDCVRQENASKLRVWNRNRELQAEVETLTQLRPYPNHEWPTVLELTRSLKQAEAEVERLKKVIEQMSDTSKATFTSIYGTKYTMEELAEVIAAYEEERH